MTTNGKVYVNGSPHVTTDEQLEELCRRHGKVKSARVVLLSDKKTRQRQGVRIHRDGIPGGQSNSHRGAQQEQPGWIDAPVFLNVT